MVCTSWLSICYIIFTSPVNIRLYRTVQKYVISMEDEMTFSNACKYHSECFYPLVGVIGR